MRIGTILATCDLHQLAYVVWLRRHGLEFRSHVCVCREDGHGHHYSGGLQLSTVLQLLRIPKGRIAFDLGVGMGIAALTLSRHFSQVVGVDLSSELIAIARRNIDKLHVANIELHCADARAFTEDLDRITHIYMFNPFPRPVMTPVLKNITTSLAKRPRPLTMIYKNPVCDDNVVAAGFTLRHSYNIRHTYPFAVYDI